MYIRVNILIFIYILLHIHAYIFGHVYSYISRCCLWSWGNWIELSRKGWTSQEWLFQQPGAGSQQFLCFIVLDGCILISWISKLSSIIYILVTGEGAQFETRSFGNPPKMARCEKQSSANKYISGTFSCLEGQKWRPAKYWVSIFPKTPLISGCFIWRIRAVD